MNHIGFKVNLKTYEGLKLEARKRKITMAEVCREVLTNYILISDTKNSDELQNIIKSQIKKHSEILKNLKDI